MLGAFCRRMRIIRGFVIASIVAVAGCGSSSQQQDLGSCPAPVNPGDACDPSCNLPKNGCECASNNVWLCVAEY